MNTFLLMLKYYIMCICIFYKNNDKSHQIIPVIMTFIFTWVCHKFMEATVDCCKKDGE